MNPYEQRAQQERKAALRLGLVLGTAGVGLVVLAIALTGFIGSAPDSFWKVAAIFVAVLLLVLRQLTRRLNKGGKPKADPESMLKLND